MKLYHQDDKLDSAINEQVKFLPVTKLTLSYTFSNQTREKLQFRLSRKGYQPEAY